jgi:Trk K+ transport system NAD-binding subunit
MIAGAAALASLFSVITEKLISKRFSQYFGFSNIRLKNHIIIAGLGKIGFRVASQLIENGEKVIAIEKEPNSDFAASLRGKVPVLTGDSVHLEILYKSGILQAKTIMALTDDDITNLNMLIFAKKINPGIKTVARIFNKRIGERAKDAFKIDKVLSVAALASPTIVASAIYRNTLGSFFFNDKLYIIFEINITTDAKMKSLSKKDIIDKYNLFPLIEIDNNDIISFIDEKISPKAYILVLIGKYEDVKRFN